LRVNSTPWLARQTPAGDVKHGGDLFPADSRKIVKEIVHTIPDLQVIHQRLDWNAGSI